MKGVFSIAVWMTLVSVLVKMLVYITGNQFTETGRFAIFANIFILLSGMFYSMRNFKKQVKNTSSFLVDFKESMKLVAFYAILMSAFVYLYYAVIDPAYFQIRLANQLEVAKEAGLNLDQVRKTGEIFLSPFTQSTVTLLGFILLGSFYAAILTFLMRKYPGFGH